MDHRIKEILAKVEKDISEPPVIRDLAASINVSVSHFQHLFKREVQSGVVKYVNNLRLERERRLLETTHLRIKDIRLRVGATNESHFLRDFKEKFGATPSDYRANKRNKMKNEIINSGNGQQTAETDSKQQKWTVKKLLTF